MIKFHFTRGEHKTYFFPVLHSGIRMCKFNYYEYSLAPNILGARWPGG